MPYAALKSFWLEIVIVILIFNKNDAYPHGYGPKIYPFNAGDHREIEPNNFHAKSPATGFQLFPPRFLQDRFRSFTPHSSAKLNFDVRDILPHFHEHANNQHQQHERRPIKEENIKIGANHINNDNVGKPGFRSEEIITTTTALQAVTQTKEDLNGKQTNIHSNYIKIPSTTEASSYVKKEETNAIEANYTRYIPNDITDLDLVEASTASRTTANINKIMKVNNKNFDFLFFEDTGESISDISTQETTDFTSSTDSYETTTFEGELDNRMHVPAGVVASLLG